MIPKAIERPTHIEDRIVPDVRQPPRRPLAPELMYPDASNR